MHRSQSFFPGMRKSAGRGNGPRATDAAFRRARPKLLSKLGLGAMNQKTSYAQQQAAPTPAENAQFSLVDHDRRNKASTAMTEQRALPRCRWVASSRHHGPGWIWLRGIVPRGHHMNAPQVCDEKNVELHGIETQKAYDVPKLSDPRVPLLVLARIEAAEA